MEVQQRSDKRIQMYIYIWYIKMWNK